MNGTQNIFNEYFDTLRVKADMIDAPSQQLNRAMIIAFMAHVQHLLTLNGLGNRRLQFKDIRDVGGELFFHIPHTRMDVVLDYDIDGMAIWEGDRRIGDTLTTGLVHEFCDWLDSRTMTVSKFKSLFRETTNRDIIDKAVQAFYGTDDPANSLIWSDSEEMLTLIVEEMERRQN